MDVLLGFSGLFAAVSIGWILLALFVALVVGGIVALFFGAIFFGMSRLAHAASMAWEEGDEQAPSSGT
ncbi:MAG TPA: hypothetical protein VK789_30135 [Bryobacteraceae bacterium]|nr:hypothetical protein [Bryobacteraceae bacterium]